MGVSGTLEYLSDLVGSGGHKHKKKKKQLQTVELKVRMDCDGCELKVKNAISSMSGMLPAFSPLLFIFCCAVFLLLNLQLKRVIHLKLIKFISAFAIYAGVKKVEINRKQQRVTVTGYVDSNKVLKKAKSTGKKAEIWPYVPYNLVAQPYAVQAYDKKAPPGYVRNVENTVTTGTVTRSYDDPYTSMFSDDNPNACSIM